MIGIEVVDGVLDEGTCNEAIGLLETAPWEEASIRDEHNTAVDSEVRTSQVQFMPFLSYMLPPVLRHIHEQVWHAFVSYSDAYDSAFQTVEMVSVNKYDPGQHYGWHMDGGSGVPRLISAVMFLNTIDEGGELEFLHGGSILKAEAGRLVLFPSNFMYKHRAIAPVFQTKYSMAYWAR